MTTQTLPTDAPTLRRFPIQAKSIYTGTNTTIPWHMAEEAYLEYKDQYGTRQSLERLAERGGFGAEEAISLLYERCQRLTKLQEKQ